MPFSDELRRLKLESLSSLSRKTIRAKAGLSATIDISEHFLSVTFVVNQTMHIREAQMERIEIILPEPIDWKELVCRRIIWRDDRWYFQFVEVKSGNSISALEIKEFELQR